MEEPLLAELTHIVRSVAILSPTTFSFAGRIVPFSDPAMSLLRSMYPSQHQLVTQLEELLYRHCYCQRFTGQVVEEVPTPAQDSSFVQALSEANTSRERWDAGWRIYQTLPYGQIIAQKYESIRMFWPGEFLTYDGFGMSPRIGASISIHVAKESLTMQPGFYFAFGEAVADQQDDYSIVRFYWNINATATATLIQYITRGLNRYQVPFRFKCLALPTQYKRTDAAVLFVSKRYYRIVAELLVDVYQRVREMLKPDTPLFTKQLAVGLGCAEDPANGESFGMSRCRLVAEGLWSAYLQGLHSEQDRLHQVVELFEKHGIALERPYLNRGSSDIYEFATE
jgi:hypothetical protein